MRSGRAGARSIKGTQVSCTRFIPVQSVVCRLAFIRGTNWASSASAISGAVLKRSLILSSKPRPAALAKDGSGKGVSSAFNGRRYEAHPPQTAFEATAPAEHEDALTALPPSAYNSEIKAGAGYAMAGATCTRSSTPRSSKGGKRGVAHNGQANSRTDNSPFRFAIKMADTSQRAPTTPIR